MVVRVVLASALALSWGVGCTGSSSPPPAQPPAAEEVVQEGIDVEIPTATYAWDPAAGDPAVPAELGGPGFTGEGWDTRLEISALGNPTAPKGGELVTDMPDWPATLRMAGKDWNTSTNYHVNSLLYMGLLDLDPVTLDYVPGLATHWKISDDRTTYRFRINPEARWSDGKPVVAQDVVASWKLRMDPTLLDPSAILTYGKLNQPKIVSKYIVEVVAKEENWRNFLYISGMSIFPAHEIGKLKGSEYLDKYQFGYTATTGPYTVNPEDIVTNQSLTMTRRTDWWAAANPVYAGMYNLDRIKYMVVKRPELAFEKLKKGELDYYAIPKAQWYADELPGVDSVQRGLLVRRKFYTDNPVGTQGLALNQARPPLDDVRVRKALQLLYDRKTMIDKLYFNQYAPLQSYYQGGLYQNPANPLFEYDEVGAVELLEQVGYTEINGEGYRTKNGQELKLEVMYRSSLSERNLTIFQEAARRAGIRIELQLLNDATAWQNVRQKEFDIASMAWGATLFPNPETSWASSLADQMDNNNITSFRSARVDALCTSYDQEYSVQRRIEIIREIDGILYQEHPYVLGWFNPAQMVVYWNRYGMPPVWGSGRYSRRISQNHLTTYWWFDEGREQQLVAAQQDPTARLEIPHEQVRFWQQWSAAQAGGGRDAGASVEPVHAVRGADAE